MRGLIRKLFVNSLKLFTAFSFYRLKSSDLVFFQFVYPGIFTIVALLSYSFLPGDWVSFKLNVFVSNATTLMGVLVGFYIAALAAVTSFPNESLNSVMSGDAPRIKEKLGGVAVAITRRRFLATLLGYCAFLSILIYILGAISASVELSKEMPPFLACVVKSVWWAVYTWFLSSLLIVTMLCLHYLVDRMHRD